MPVILTTKVGKKSLMTYVWQGILSEAWQMMDQASEIMKHHSELVLAINRSLRSECLFL